MKNFKRLGKDGLIDSWLNEPFFKEYIAYKQLTSETLSSFLFFPAQHETFSYPMHIGYSLLMAYATTKSMENQQQNLNIEN